LARWQPVIPSFAAQILLVLNGSDRCECLPLVTRFTANGSYLKRSRAFIVEKCHRGMLRRKKFRPSEKKILFAIGLVLLTAGLVGVFLAVQQSQWRLGIVSIGILAIAAVYLNGSRRGWPL